MNQSNQPLIQMIYLKKISESGYCDSKSKNEQIQRFIHDQNQTKRIIEFSIQD
jgi:hypothetical protein